MNIIDVNCDMGEGFGRYSLGTDNELMPYISSANIACGFHAGDASTMNKTVKLALEHGVAIGAHPGFPDRQGFGRRGMDLSPREVYEIILYQVGALNAFVVAQGGKLHHIKPHGALYNMAARDHHISEAIAEAISSLNADLLLYGLAGSELVRAGERIGLTVASEVFADRTYERDGTLTPRSMPNAVIKDENSAIQQAVRMIMKGQALTAGGEVVNVDAHTICLHGDHPSALPFAKKLHKEFQEFGIEVRALTKK